MLVLLLGEAYIPLRAADLPNAFKALLDPQKRIGSVLMTGNGLASDPEMAEWLSFIVSHAPPQQSSTSQGSVVGQVVAVAGDCDGDSDPVRLSLPSILQGD